MYLTDSIFVVSSFHHISHSWLALLFSLNTTGKGIIAEHNHVDFSNNMMRWRFVGNTVEDNSNGGLYLELPLILDPYLNGNHSVDINNSR